MPKIEKVLADSERIEYRGLWERGIRTEFRFLNECLATQPLSPYCRAGSYTLTDETTGAFGRYYTEVFDGTPDNFYSLAYCGAYEPIRFGWDKQQVLLFQAYGDEAQFMQYWRFRDEAGYEFPNQFQTHYDLAGVQLLEETDIETRQSIMRGLMRVGERGYAHTETHHDDEVAYFMLQTISNGLAELAGR